MKKIFTLTILILFLLPIVLADGMMIDPHGYLPEKQQVAAIDYKNGRQDMILTIQTDELRSEKAAWIFPVPGKHDDIVIDVVENFPSFYGQEIEQKAKSNIENIMESTTLTQIYPLFFRWGGDFYAGTSSMGGYEKAEGISVGYGNVTVYEHIEKYGVTTELLDAASGLDLYVYLKSEGLDFEFSSIPMLNDYLGKDYTFVISWIQNTNTPIVEPQYAQDYPYYYGRRIGVKISFPTEEIFYPLKPTSVYESAEVPATIYVTGLVTPQVYDDIKNYVTTKYYTTNNIQYIEELSSNYNYDNSPKTYTRIDMNPPSKLLKEDLVIKQEAPNNMHYAAAIANNFDHNNSRYWTWSFIIALSAGVGALLGLVIFRQPGKFALVGLANCLSIIGLIIATIFVKTKVIDPKLKQKIDEAGLRVTTADSRKIIFVIAFSVLFLLFSWLLGLILKLPL